MGPVDSERSAELLRQLDELAGAEVDDPRVAELAVEPAGVPPVGLKRRICE